jgi:hypothetical protein
MKREFPLLHYIVSEGYNYTRQLLKNCVKFLLGRKLHHDARFIFFRKYILHRIGVQRIRAVTCAMSSDKEGAASLASLTTCTINFARVSGLAYLHTPLSIVCHADRPMQQWAAAWESLFNLGAGEEPRHGRRRGVVDVGSYALSNLNLCFGLRGREQELLDGFRALIPEFRRKYYLNKSPRTTDEITVAVHIRRGDVTAHAIPQMYTSTDRVLRITSEVKSILDSRGSPFSMRVYSQGNIEDFSELSPLGAEFFLDADAVWTMQELIEADVLIVAKGNFSYYAGVISDGIKIYEPHILGPADEIRQLPNVGTPAVPLAWSWSIFSELNDWLPCQQDGSFDRTSFERQLDLLLQEKEAVRASRSGQPGA